jgi:hypothetical protein
METKMGVGHSFKRNPGEAGKEAAMMALRKAGIMKPDFVFVFATIGYNQQILIRSIREATSEAPLSGCSGEGIITQETAIETNFGVCVMVIHSDELRFNHSYIDNIKNAASSAGEQLALKIAPYLSSDNIACFLFADGLVFNFDPFLSMFEKTLACQNHLPIFGGLASDNLETKKTYQYHDDQILSEGISCVVMSGLGRIAWGINHGCVPVGTMRTITRSEGNIIYEIDGIPALEALEDYFEQGWKDNWNKTSLNLCLGFKTPEDIKKNYGEYIIRYMMSKNDQDSSVTIQSDVTNGTGFWIVRRDKDLIKDGMQSITSQIKTKAGSEKPKFVFHFDCVGRGKVVFREEEKNELIKSFQKDIGEDIPWIGFYTYGEIGPVAGINCSHNFTAVVAAVY